MFVEYLNNQSFMELDNALSDEIIAVGLKTGIFKGNRLLFVEYEDCYTAPNIDNTDCYRVNNIMDLKLPLYKTNRGGEITFHGKGQIAIHCIMDLHAKQWKIVRFIEYLMTSVVDVLDKYIDKKYEIHTHDNTGIFIYCDGNELCKVGSIGVRVQHGITYYGVSLNYNVDLSHYDQINICGNKSTVGGNMTTYSNIDKETLINEIKNSLITNG